VSNPIDVENPFGAAFAEYGGPLNADKINPATAIGLDELLRFFRSILTNPGAFAQNVECGWIDNYNFNAAATLYKDREFIGMFFGASLIIHHHYLCFLSDPSVLVQIGDAKNETRNVKAIQSLLWDQPDYVFPDNPVDQKRLQTAQHLGFCTMIFLFFHELAHVNLCHLRLLAEQHGSATYLELPTNQLTSSEAHLRVLLELHADDLAAQNSHRFWRAMWDKAAFPALSSLDPDFLWSISVTMLFSIFDSFCWKLRPVYTTHPPPLVRFLQVLTLPESGLNITAARSGLDEVFKWWESNGLMTSPGTRGLSLDPGKEINALRYELFSKYGPRLRQLQKERKAELGFF
jgi:hypothetical protein